MGWLPRLAGLYELTAGGAVAAAALLGACCVLRALVILAEAAVQPRQPAVAGRGAVLSGPALAGEALLAGGTVLAGETVLSEEIMLARRAGLTGSTPQSALGEFGPESPAVRGRLARACAYAAEAGLTAGQWLGSFLLLSALIAGVLLYIGKDGFILASRTLAPWEAACAGCGLAGSLLFALVIRVRHSREARRARIALPHWLTLHTTTALLVAIAVAEYWIFASNANGRLRTAESWHPAWEGLYWIVVGAQFAAMLMGTACVARWVLAGWRAIERDAPPGY